MAAMDSLERLAANRRPARSRQGSQRWDSLLFAHWEVPAEVVRPQVDPRLTLDTFDGRCFVGVVAFTMQRVRPWQWLPTFPTTRTFGEINVRTYVHLDGREPGVWFCSLDAGSTLAVLAARALWHLPYFRSKIASDDHDEQRCWRSVRRWPRPAAEPFSARCRVGEALPASKPGTLEFFLAERYQFYTTRGGRLLRGRVHHEPYPLHTAQDVEVTPSLLQAAGFPATGARTVDLFSPGVDVDIFAIETL
jgi:uncharacterized protein YqjF (DUF2071 family)